MLRGDQGTTLCHVVIRLPLNTQAFYCITPPPGLTPAARPGYHAAQMIHIVVLTLMNYLSLFSPGQSISFSLRLGITLVWR